MANQNLSQFTEKTFVADADWTFVWDTAGAISKKVSRNSLLNSGTLAGASAPITVSQTWNDAAVAFTALKVNAVSTASAAGSLLLDLQVGTVSQFKVDKTGNLTTTGTSITTAANGTWGTPSAIEVVSGGHIRWASRGRLYSQTADSISILDSSATLAATLAVDANNTLALRNGAAPQTFRVYNTYTDASNYERGELVWSGNTLYLQAVNLGTGSQRALSFGGLSIAFRTNSGSGLTGRWDMSSAGHFLASADNTYDIGASGANRPRALYLAAGITAGGVISGQSYGASASGYFNWATRSQLTSPADGVIRLSNDAQNDFNRLQLGGTADTHPAIARDGAGIKITGAAAGLTSHIKVPAVAVGSLPAAATAGVGARAFVNDALAPVFGSTVANGGAVAVPVYSDGSAWKVG